MGNISSGLLLIILSGVVVISYLFSIISKYIKVPSVLLLLFTGIGMRLLSGNYGWQINFPGQIVELLGSVGLIIIVLEAGLDLKLKKSKAKLIRNSLLAAIFILIVSVAGVTLVLHYLLAEDVKKCIVYAIPLSIMSSSIVIPSLHHLTANKKEFLIYEASFSDMIGLVVFNYFTGDETVSVNAAGSFFLNVFIAVVLSLIFSVLLFIILTKSTMNVRFFLIFALLLILYEGGKMMNLPSLIIILIFGLLMNNWNLVKIPRMQSWFPHEEVKETNHLLHSLTAESSFLIRTFFFILFGFSIDVNAFLNSEIILIGSAIVLVLLLSRFLYLRFFLKESIYPEVVFIPRGLITILLFYKIPAAFRLQSFNDGILFFVILVTSFIMMLGMLFYKKKPEDIAEFIKE